MYLPKDVYPFNEINPKRQTVTNKKRRSRNHVYTVDINNIRYYKVHLHRNGKSTIKYFKQKKQAFLFLELIRITKMI